MNSETTWMINSNIEHHTCKEAQNLVEIYKSHGDRITGKIAWIREDGTELLIPISDVHVDPKIKYNSLSERKMLENGFTLNYEYMECQVMRKNELIIIAKLINDEYVFRTKSENQEKANTCAEYTSSEEEELMCVTHEPDNWKEISQYPQREKEIWTKAMENEMSILFENNVLTECKPNPEKQKIIGSRWTYAVKRDENNKVKKIRARLVAKGFAQRPGIDYFDTYAPVVRHVTIRTMLSMASSQLMSTLHCDINSAFLYGQLDEELYLEEPEGPGKGGEKIFRIHRSIYGLKQAAHNWNTRINVSLENLDLKASENDSCLYIKRKRGTRLFILIHVDDILIIGDSPDEMSDVVSKLSQEYQIKNLGRASCYLGLHIVSDPEDPRIIYLHQIPKIERLLENHHMENCKSASTPMIPDFIKSQGETLSATLPDNNIYQRILGSLLYLAITTRPDIMLATNILGRKTSNPTEYDWQGMKRVLRYMKSSKKYLLRLGGKPEFKYEAFSDADWGGDRTTRKSTSGQMHFLGKNMICWGTKGQNSVSLSSAEAEYIAAAQCAQEVLWIRRLLGDLGLAQDSPIILHTDSQSGMAMAEGTNFSKRTKHIEIKYLFIKDLISKKILTLQYCPTEIMRADILTKPLARDKFDELVQCMGLTLKENINCTF